MQEQRHQNEDEPVIEVTESVSLVDEHVADLMSHTIDISALATAVTKQKAADAADTLEDLADDEAAEVIELMEDQAAADALAEMEVPLAVTIVEDLSADGRIEYASKLLLLLAPDDAVSIIRGLNDEIIEPIFVSMPVGYVRKLRQLCDYEEESAAGIMTTDFVSLSEDMTISKVVDLLRERELPEHVQDLPVINKNDELVGVVSLRSLLIGMSNATVAEIMVQKVAAVHSGTDREQVAREFDRYGYEMLPVLDGSNRLLGIITVDDVIDIIEEEQTEDVQKTVGAGAGEAVYSGVGEKLKGRMPWLIVSAVMMLPATYVVLGFESMIREVALLAVFMPLIAALAGNAGHQALAVTLRGIVLDEVRPDRIFPLIRRELFVGIITGATIGGAVALLLWIFGSSELETRVGIIFACAMVVSMAVGTLTGAAIPLIMKRVGADPAQASAIFLIMVTDAVAFSTLLSFAWIALQWMKET
ncbi:MAG TPA: magnesium transporter [Phycisphaerales bacterium]|nr:magnesium transporter [Phycisphaerales bacterium]HIB49689.1 magnesium transporter [Phycisphaerales bacterium]HIN84564.1 magnesium transporter [Phycisphaerales bacterium]HIO20069.1 magnesium transporter [Phycisphaerales bacterium]HIO52917.1 magnesium transporter [Phycisphaerales bacterium]